MKTIGFKQIMVLGCWALAFLAGSCGRADIDPYDSKDKIWFTQKNDDNVAVNDILRSFSLYPGAETLDVTFQVNLIGSVTDYDRTYAAVVVDSLTTAVPSEYEIHPMVLHAGKVSDELRITLKKSERLQSEEVKLTLYIVANEAFDPGYSNSLQVCVRFNDITTCPEWWTEDVANAYFGPYSKEKFEAFYAYSGRNDIEGLQPSELRKLLLGFKEYIRENNITEADGSEMIIPVY